MVVVVVVVVLLVGNSTTDVLELFAVLREGNSFLFRSLPGFGTRLPIHE